MGGCEGRMCWTAGAGYGLCYTRLWSAMVGHGRSGPHSNGGSQVCGTVSLGNAIANR